MWPSMSASRSASGDLSPEASSETLSCPCGQQPLADADEQFGEHRVLAREVPVEAGAADADGGTYLVDADPVEAALGKEAGGLLEDLLAAGGSRDAGGGMGAHEQSF